MWDPFKEHVNSMKYIMNFFNIHLVSIFGIYNYKYRKL